MQDRIELGLPEEPSQRPAKPDGDPLVDNILSPNRMNEDPSLINFQSKEKQPQDGRALPGVS